MMSKDTDEIKLIKKAIRGNSTAYNFCLTYVNKYKSCRRFCIRKDTVYMMSKDTDEIKLIKKAIRGNSTAYGYLIEKHRTYLYKMAFLYTKNEQDALDVVGDTVLKGYLQIKTLKNASLFQTWITRVLINTAHDHRRKALSTLSQEDSAIDSAHASTANQQIPSVEHFDLQTAIETLPDKYRIPILLKYFSGMTVDEIAWTLSIPSGSVKAYLSRGRNELKQKLKEDYLYES